MEPKYPYEGRPELVDRWINWRNARNRFIERAPVVVLTGAGASIPAGIPGLGLPETITVAPGVSFETEELTPPPDAASSTDVLDLETLLIVADVLREFPREVVYEGVGGPSELHRHRAVLGHTVRSILPTLAGGPSLSQRFVNAVIDRLIELDRRHEGAVLDGLPDAITGRIFDACLGLRRDELVELYGPLLAEIASFLETAGAPLVVPVFTTNYDETFDYLAEDLVEELSASIGREVVFADGAEPGAARRGWRTFDPKAYARFRPPQGSLALVVFYLHGSLRWFWSAEAKPGFEIYIAPGSEARTRPEGRALLQPDGQKVVWGRSHAEISDLLVPERKDPFRPGAPYYPVRLGYLFLERCLRKAAALVGIGYSFRDSDCRDLLLEAWERRGSPRLVLLDPKPEPIVARLGPAPVVGQVRRRFEPGAAGDVAAALDLAGNTGRST